MVLYRCGCSPCMLCSTVRTSPAVQCPLRRVRRRCSNSLSIMMQAYANIILSPYKKPSTTTRFWMSMGIWNDFIKLDRYMAKHLIHSAIGICHSFLHRDIICYLYFCVSESSFVQWTTTSCDRTSSSQSIRERSKSGEFKRESGAVGAAVPLLASEFCKVSRPIPYKTRIVHYVHLL